MRERTSNTPRNKIVKNKGQNNPEKNSRANFKIKWNKNLYIKEQKLLHQEQKCKKSKKWKKLFQTKLRKSEKEKENKVIKRRNKKYIEKTVFEIKLSKKWNGKEPKKN
jgi:hypothetical protein